LHGASLSAGSFFCGRHALGRYSNRPHPVAAASSNARHFQQFSPSMNLFGKHLHWAMIGVFSPDFLLFASDIDRNLSGIAEDCLKLLLTLPRKTSRLQNVTGYQIDANRFGFP
jgi:hypothetical protein